jgi:dolichol-phosphate mannosyltransferase
MENKTKFSFLVALPMYNEEDYAEKCVCAVNDVLAKIGGQTAIVAINDGSQDNTLSILKSLSAKINRLIIIEHFENQGYGAAIKSAYKYGADNFFDYVIFMDADLTQDPSSILDFLPEMNAGIDFIKASRYIKGSRVIGVPRHRVLISAFGNIIARLAFHLPITDYTNGFRAVKISVAQRFTLESTHFPILVEEMWQARYYAKSFAEVSYTLRSRINEKDSKFSYNINIYKQYLKYCLYSFLGVKPR